MIDAGQVNTNFSDIIAGTSDGTKDFNIAALTVAGIATLNGNVLLGNASGDDIQFNGSLATSIPIKTTNTYDIGAVGKGLAGIYISVGGTHAVRIVGSSSGTPAAYTLTLPSTAGSSGQALLNTGSGTLDWTTVLQSNNSSVRLNSGNGHGSTNTKIRRFSNNTVVGTGLTYADSATAGMSITVNETGIYAISFADRSNSAVVQVGISVNSASLTTNVFSLTDSEIVFMCQAAQSAYGTCAATVRLTAGDVIRAHTDGASTDVGVGVRFVMTQIAKL